MFSKKEYPLTSLKQIIRDFSYNRALKLLFDVSARSYDYIFSSVEGNQPSSVKLKKNAMCLQQLGT